MKKILFVLLLLAIYSCNKSNYRAYRGGMYGTTFSIIYNYHSNLDKYIYDRMNSINASLSMFNPNSTISKFNQKGVMQIAIDSDFEKMYTKAVEVYEATDGAFDISVAPLINAWGFGYKHQKLPTDEVVDSIMNFIGMDKVTMENHFIKKKIDGVELDASSIAKGLGVDLVAEYLDDKNIKNYMVEIGGEVRVKGVNRNGVKWRVGIDKPLEHDKNREIQLILNMDDGAVATSGNYRNFYIKDGHKYTHTINPHTGYPVSKSILSASVYSATCMEADAYATAFMVLGLDAAKSVIKNVKSIEGLIIYGEEDNIRIWMSDGFAKLTSE